ncbi:acyl-CoA N-acyltransferase [Mycena haematopus]|nr:acyl-CoA N-acyltransferase [Mycena haematopus]
MSDSSPPPPVVVPRPGAAGDIIIRQFQPRDADQIHAMLVEGLVYGPESPRNVAHRRNFVSRISCLAYLGSALGLGCWRYSTNPVLRVAGGALVLGATVLFFYKRRAITKLFLHFCANARVTDMADISRSYGVPLSAEGMQGPGGFWVAAIESPDHKTSEVVGYLGLDYHANSDPSSGELRRMIVSVQHRRRRIGSLLIVAALAHARLHTPPLASLDLETSEFQPGARKLYEKHGFSLVGARIMHIGPLFSARVIRMRRNIRLD